MNRISSTIEILQKTRKKAFIPFITAGYPSLESTLSIVQALERAGASMIELGMPFSDPLADGPAIQESSYEALCNGATPDKVFECIKKIRSYSEIPLIIFTYSNLVFHKGIDIFMRLVQKSGGDGIIVPDVPIEESTPFIQSAHRNKLRMIQLISPLSSPDRMKHIEMVSDDFVYCVSIMGVTGTQNKLYTRIQEYLKNVRETLTKPFMVGFGISNPEDARNIAQESDGIIVGSALVSLIKQYKNSSLLYEQVYQFAQKIHSSILY
jgi:tryptophan synthase alpha chain